MNIDKLFEQFIAPGNASATPADDQSARPAPPAEGTSMLQQLATGKAGSFAGGLAAGGLLGALAGNKKMRKRAKKMAGGALGYGGSAVLGALALKAYQNWQADKEDTGTTNPSASSVPKISQAERFDPSVNTDATGQPMQLALIKAMIAAANADGHIDQEEQAKVFEAVDKMGLDSEAKAMIFDVLRNPPSVSQIAAYAEGLEQASEIYMASRLAIDPDQHAERQYLRDLAAAMSLPDGLVHEIELQFEPEAEPGHQSPGSDRHTHLVSERTMAP